jgi:plasmid stabilization system protein ParE
MAIIEWSLLAITDITDITEYYTEVADFQTASEVSSAILSKVQDLSDTRFLGKIVEGATSNYRLGYAIKGTYKIYYQVKGNNHIKVLYIVHSRKLPPTPKDLTKASKR